MKVFIDSDHHGVDFIKPICNWLEPKYEFHYVNYGIDKPYPLVASNIVKYVSENPDSRAILICSTGIGMSIVANKFKGISANNCSSVLECENFRKNNDGNILCLGSDFITIDLALEICESFFNTDFEVSHQDRINLIQKLHYGN